MSTNNRYEQIFGNFFDNERITDLRLLNFGDDAQGRLAADNGDGRFNGVIANITNAGNVLRSEVSDVDVALSLQKGATLTTDKVLAGFKFTMSNSEGAIAYALGGRDTTAYLQFYPRGISEYTQATKTVMPLLTERVFTAANANKASLPPALVDELTIYKNGWANARGDQELKKGSLSDNRGERNSNRITYEQALLQAIHQVAGLYPGDVNRGRQYFNFSMLFSFAKHTHQTITGTLDANEHKTAVNRIFPGNATITARNKDNNADFIIWCGATENEMPGAAAIAVHAGESKTFTPAQLGNDAAKPFLLLLNGSIVNECDYEIEIVG